MYVGVGWVELYFGSYHVIQMSRVRAVLIPVSYPVLGLSCKKNGAHTMKRLKVLFQNQKNVKKQNKSIEPVDDVGDFPT